MGKICAKLNVGLVCIVAAALALTILVPAACWAQASVSVGNTTLQGGSEVSIECNTNSYSQAALYISYNGGPEVLIHDGDAMDVDPSFTWTVPGVDAVNCVIRLDAYDFVYGDGEQATTVPFSIDSSGPTFSDISVGGGAPHFAKQGDSVTITFTASEPLGANPTVKVNGHDADYDTNSAEDYTYTYEIAPADADGLATISITGIDGVGNPSVGPTTDSTLLFVDKTAPVIDDLSAPAYCKSGTVAVDFQVSDPNGADASGIKQVSLWLNKDGEGWVDSGLAPMNAVDGTFNYAAVDGSYVFGVVVEDNAGNKSANPPAITQTTVYDTILPSIMCPAAVNVDTDAGECYATNVVLGAPVVSDGGSGLAGPATNDAPAQFNKGVTTVTWTVSDLAGNSNTCAQLVTVADHENPTINAPADINVNTDAGQCYATVAALGAPAVSDNCPGAGSSNDHPANNQYAKGINVVVWTATDTSGNTGTDTQTITVTDNEKPTISAPANINVNTDPGQCYATVAALGAPTSSDNCPGTVVTDNSPANKQYAKGVNTVTWTATDASGNVKTAVQTITVADHENPTINAPADINVNTDAGQPYATVAALGAPAVSDNCPGAGSSNDHPANNHYPKGVNVVTWTVTDTSGNTGTDTQTITVTDNEKPTINAPADINVNTDAGECYATVAALGAPVVSDNCAGVGSSNDHPANNQYAKGINTVTWTATDASGNTETDVQTITVTDNEKPTISAPADINVNTDAGECYATVAALGAATSHDNCPGTVVTDNSPANDQYAKGINTVTWTATDASGNTETDVQTITVTDIEKPTITAPADINVNTDPGKCYATVAALGAATSHDNCPGTVVTDNSPANDQYAKGITTVTWTATDASGNTETDVQTITVTDIEKPEIDSPADINVNTDPGKNYATILPAGLGVPDMSDNCPGSVASDDHPGNNHYPKGITVVTWTATDASGNTKTDTQTITVTDIEKPTAGMASSPQFENALPGVHPILVTYAAAADNCGVKLVHLWFSKNDGAWTDSMLSSASLTGTFNFTGMTGNGIYRFALRTEDESNNMSAMPVGRGDTATIYDIVAPTFNSITVTGSPAKLGAGIVIKFYSSETLPAAPIVKVNGHSASLIANTGWGYSYGYTIQSSDYDGAATITISGADVAANPGSITNTTALKVDKTVPDVASIVSSATNYVFFKNAGLCPISWTCHDVTSGVASAQFQCSSDGGTTWANYGAAVLNPPSSGVTQLNVASMTASDEYRFRLVLIDKAGNTRTGPASDLYAIYNQADLHPTVEVEAPANGSYSVSGMTIQLKARVEMPVFHDPRNTDKAWKESDPGYWFANINGIQPVLREYKKNASGAPASKPVVKTLATLGAAQRTSSWDGLLYSAKMIGSQPFLTRMVTFEWAQSYTLSTKLIGSVKDVFQLEVPLASVLSIANTKPADKVDPGAATRAKEPLIGDSDPNYNLLKREFARFWLLR